MIKEIFKNIFFVLENRYTHTHTHTRAHCTRSRHFLSSFAQSSFSWISKRQNETRQNVFYAGSASHDKFFNQ